MNESEFIKKYFLPISNKFKPSINLQDDAAILPNFKKENFIISVDNFIEGIHCPSLLNPKLMIIRAIFCATSDLAAMSAIPYCIFLSLTIPSKKGKKFFKNISDGIKEAISAIGIDLAGGDLTSYDGPFAISVTVVGRKKSFKKALLRKGSSVGDFVGVTGFIGDAYIGLKILEKKTKLFNLKQKKTAINSFLYPPQLHKFSYKLSNYAKTCIDISDGLVEDINKLAEMANCGINLSMDSLPLSSFAKRLLRKGDFTIKDYITAGDDYQLAFTFNKKNSKKIKNLEKKFNLKVSIIGELINRKGIFLDNKNISGGFSHF
tara:strand:+ start:306 stop:1262 length:957 start_codon:yes stop_codon:yes gene_type:complete